MRGMADSPTTKNGGNGNGLSKDSAIDAVLDSGDEDLLRKVLCGKLSADAAARYVKHKARKPQLPTPGKNGTLSSDNPVVTVVHGDNSDLVANVANLYLHAGEVVCHVTLGRSVFWKQIDLSAFDFHGTDIALEPSVDLRHLPYADEFADHLVLDPPHIHDTGIPRYNSRRTIGAMSHNDIIAELYGGGLKEARRVLKPGGCCWVKCCDEVIGGKQLWSHIEIYGIAMELGFTAVDLFILHRAAPPLIRHERQCHARKNHSFLWIFRKTETRVRDEVQDEAGSVPTPAVIVEWDEDAVTA